MTLHAHRHGALLASAVFAALIGGAYAWHVTHRDPGPAFEFELAPVDRGPILAKITATGTLNPIVTVQVGTQVSGTIEKLGADFNSRVTPGQMVAQIDPTLFRASVDQARANLLAAHATTHEMRARIEDAKRTAHRNQVLVDQQLLAQATVDASNTAVNVAVAQLDHAVAAEAQARAALATAETNLRYTTIRSPIAGTVITRNVDVGQTVAASLASPTLFLIGQDLTKMQVDTSIAEADVGRIAPGMVATFTVDAYPAILFRGAIRQVRTSPQVVQNVVTYDAVVDVDNPRGELAPGMTANLEVLYADREDVLRVPNSALRFRAPPELAGPTVPPPPAGTKVVWILGAGAPRPVQVTPGVSDGTYTEILAGELRPGDQVVTEANPTHRASARIL